jgi:hypothetical protein
MDIDRRARLRSTVTEKEQHAQPTSKVVWKA